MKILYGEGNFLDVGHQILAYPASVGEDAVLQIEKEVLQKVPDVRQSVFNMYAKNDNFDYDPPILGDVIWTQTSGSKWIAHCIMFDEEGNINFDALRLCMQSLKKKAIELGQEQIGIPLRWFPQGEMRQLWVRTYEEIEDVLSEQDDETIIGKFQMFAYDPDSKYVRDVFESLPGTKRAFYSDVQIRFKDR
jgi:hypothetical protein